LASAKGGNPTNTRMSKNKKRAGIITLLDIALPEKSDISKGFLVYLIINRKFESIS
jgi:hypothetical protein